MDLNTILNNILTSSLGAGIGAGVVIKIFAGKYLESIKKEYQKEVEHYKAQLYFLRETFLRYTGQQFELYTKLWHSLYDLKSIADLLWENPTRENLRKFSEQLKKTIDEVEKSFLFIEDKHYRELKELLNEFSEYKIGKRKLIKLYSKKNWIKEVDLNEIQQWINHNREKKERYEQLINRIRDDLKKQIKGADSAVLNYISR